MSEKNISDVRAALFAVLDGLADKGNPMDIERAKAINDTCQVLINTAKVEIDYLKVNNGGESSFLEAIGNDALPQGITGIRQHRLK